ncbi:MAG TPA: DUF6498-containing protein [Anaerolineae bacterium]|nr:DUF6498-containing protein [Anaerolineae bacterium]
MAQNDATIATDVFRNPFSSSPSPLDENQVSALERRSLLPTEDFRGRTLFVIARNVIPILGVLFLGWSAPNLMILYFVDTLGSMWAMIAALAMRFSPNLFSQPLSARLWTMLGLLAASVFLVAFMAIPLGMPLFILMAVADVSLQDALADEGFIYGLLTIGALALIGMLRYLLTLQANQRGEEFLRREFGLVFTRWIVILLLIYFVAIALGNLGIIVLVIGYGIASVVSELYPDRFLNMFDSSRRTENVDDIPVQESRHNIPRRKKKKGVH